jgi:ankyrin repeat protein
MYPSDSDLKEMASAIERGDIDKVRHLIATRIYVRGTHIDRAEKQTALHLAAMYGEVEICRLLLRHGADVRALNVRNNTPLHAVVGIGRDDKAAAVLCALFVRRGASVDARNSEGMTALAFASGSREVESARVLLRHGADARTTDDAGVTPLHRAAGARDAEMCRLLLQAGAQVQAYDRTGATALHKMCDGELFPRQAELNEVTRLLIDAGARADFVPTDLVERFDTVFKTSYLTPFQRSVRMGSLWAIRLFVEECGEDPEQATLDGRTMLNVAGCFQPRVVELLCSLAVDRAISSAIEASSEAGGSRSNSFSSPVL